MSTDFSFTRHAREQMRRRGIIQADLEAVLDHPEQIVPGHGGLRVYQAVTGPKEKPYLLRAIVDDRRDPGVVITVYRTRKLSKYLESE